MAGETTSAKRILKPMYTRLLEDLHILKLCAILYEKDLLTEQLKEKIENSDRREANKLFIDSMITNRTISSVKLFSQILIDTSEELGNQKHKIIGQDLLATTRQVVDYKTSVTPSSSIISSQPFGTLHSVCKRYRPF